MNEEPKDIKSIFAEAIEKKSSKERAAFLDKACGADGDLRSKVEDLLRAHSQAGDFLEEPPIGSIVTLGDPHLTEGPGTIISRYKLLEQIGEGGMAVVYMAEQKEPIRRKVALKVIKLGMDTKQVIARFEAERQALAMMDHPNIAKVLDAGATETGRPYFVMELVKGVSITEYCDKNKLNTRERLDLFMQVCNAVQHAHQKGIIHRDIKPSNVMVTLLDGQPVTKVIDFGIAKATSLELTEKTLFTRYAQMIGTPEYMSPEQAEMCGLDVDTRTDIYSLGVLLYQLLTGALPFDPEMLRASGYAEIRRTIVEDEPPRPSTRLSSLGEEAKKVAESRGTKIALLVARLRKELEWIPLKAIRKDRTRRYRSAAEMSDDVQNYLNGAPLIAGPESTLYRLKKSIHRNRALVISIFSILAVLLAGIVVSMVFAVRAERQARISQAVSDFLRNDLLGSADPWSGRTEGATVVSFLDAASKRLEGKFADEPLIEASIRYTFGSTYHHLGRYSEAENHLRRCLEIRRDRLGNEDFETLNCMRELGWVYRELGNNKQAEMLLVEALEGMRRTLDKEHDALLSCMGWRAGLYFDQGRYDEAERLYAEGLEVIQRKLGAEHSWAAVYMHWIGVVYQNQRRFDEAEKLLTEALDIRRRTNGDLDSETLYIIHDLGLLYSDQERYEDAERLLAEALEGRRKVVGEGHPETLRLMGTLGRLYRRQGKLDQAEQLLSECYRKSREVLGEEHPTTSDLIPDLAVLYYRQGKIDEMAALTDNVVEVVRSGLLDESLNPMMLHMIHSLGMWYLHIGREVEAETLLGKALEVRRRMLGEEHPDTQASVGMDYFRRGQYDKAEPLLIKALEDERRKEGQEVPPLISIYNLALVHHRQGDYDKAEPLLVEVVELSEGVLIEGHPDTVAAMNELIKLYEAWEKPQKAQEWRSKLPRKKGTEEQ
ncbi:MAG: serine/threonine protein kinase [Planctomycetes bacterium]|nr:serine/threonine protein kinase [Planctomycetota bacterium]